MERGVASDSNYIQTFNPDNWKNLRNHILTYTVYNTDVILAVVEPTFQLVIMLLDKEGSTTSRSEAIKSKLKEILDFFKTKCVVDPTVKKRPIYRFFIETIKIYGEILENTGAIDFESLNFAYEYEFTLKIKSTTPTRLIKAFIDNLSNGTVYEPGTFANYFGHTTKEVVYHKIDLSQDLLKKITDLLKIQ